MDTISQHRPAGSKQLSKPALFAMAAASGIAVANIYYNQPMLGIIENEFQHQPITGFIPTATQLGYALGLFFLLPLGDLVHRRKLIIGQFIVLAVALALAAIAPSAWSLVAMTDGSALGWYSPIVSMARPSRLVRASATTMR